MANRKEKESLKKRLRSIRGASGAYRKAYFEEGGDLAQWRGRSSVYSDNKKQANKSICRKKVKYEV